MHIVILHACSSPFAIVNHSENNCTLVVERSHMVGLLGKAIIGCNCIPILIRLRLYNYVSGVKKRYHFVLYICFRIRIVAMHWLKA